jgi:hypothetical protein
MENLENSGDQNIDWCHSGTSPNYESSVIPETDAMGREKFWEDLGRPENDGLALKIFKEQCCSNCSCKPTQP